MGKKVWFYSGDITNSGGTERVAITIANQLNKREEFQVSFLSLVEKKKTPAFEIDSTVKRHTIYDHEVRGITHIFGIIHRTRKLVKKNQVDILIDIDGILEMYTIPALAFTKTKIVSWEHYNFYQNPVVPYRKYTRRMAARWADAIVTLTEEDKKYYCDNLNIRCSIQAIYNPVMPKNIDKGYNIDAKMILSAGRLTYQKGFDLLIDIADMFLKKYPDWKWVVLGEGEDREFLESEICKKKLKEQLLLPGNVDNIDEYYVESAMFVMTSRFEGLPMTLLETKPFQLPLVSFDCKTGPSELIEDGVNGYLIQEGHKEEMAEKIELLINHPDIRIGFSHNATNKMERFDLQIILDKWVKLLNTL